jgi:hypothetical protein
MKMKLTYTPTKLSALKILKDSKANFETLKVALGRRKGLSDFSHPQ